MGVNWTGDGTFDRGSVGLYFCVAQVSCERVQYLRQRERTNVTFAPDSSCCNPVLFIMLDVRWKRSAREILGIKRDSSDIESEDNPSRKASAVPGQKHITVIATTDASADLERSVSVASSPLPILQESHIPSKVSFAP